MISAAALAALVAFTPVADAPARVSFGYNHHTMQGVEASAYRGDWFVAGHEAIRRCIVWRESRGRYGAKPWSSSASGAYQFIREPVWRKSLGWMLYPELKADLGPRAAKQIRAKLWATPIYNWGRYWQDAAFWTVWRKGAGRHHWAPTVPGTGCY